MYLLKFNHILKDSTALVGGKASSLGEMTNTGIPVPPGFVVTTEAYKQFSKQEIPIDVQEEILRAFDNLGADLVAVRSSAVGEDSSTASWAGQLESYLNTTKENLIENIRQCWNSIHSERALAYAAEQNLPEDELEVAVVVQKMVDSEAAGVIFTVNPITRDKDEVMIEAGFGLGEMLVQGMITPDNFVVAKDTLEIVSRKISSQETMLVFQDGENKEVPVPTEQKSKPALTDNQVQELSELGKKIEDHYGSPQDIEWAVDDEDKIWILQSRPITTLKN